MILLYFGLGSVLRMEPVRAGVLLLGGLFLLGIIYDYWTLNGQVDAANGAQLGW